MAEPKFRPHKLIEKLTTREGGAIKLLGYFGSTSEGVVKVYPSLDDLSIYYEIQEADILHVEDAPADELPHGGSAIWVKADARVERCVSQRTSTEARFLTGEITARMARGPAVTYRALTRRAIVPETGGGPACEYSKVWPCSALRECLETVFPCVETQQWGCNIYTDDTCLATCAGYTCLPLCHTFDQCPRTVQLCTNRVLTVCC